MKRKLQAKSGVIYPINLEVGITEANLQENEPSIVGVQNKEDLKIYYKIDNGKEIFRSTLVSDVTQPVWADIFELVLKNNKEKIFFEIITRLDGMEITDKVIDSFDLSANIMEQQLKVTEFLTDNLCTSIGRIPHIISLFLILH